MEWSYLDLILFTGAVYGMAWLITQSKLTRRTREALASVPFFGSLLQCIVCTATWIGIGLALALPWTTLFSPTFRAETVVDVLILASWSLASSWALGRLLGDAYKEGEEQEHD